MYTAFFIKQAAPYWLRLNLAVVRYVGGYVDRHFHEPCDLVKLLDFPLHRFDYMMACGTDLVHPRLMSSQVMDGNTCHRIYGTKTVYLKPAVELLKQPEMVKDLFSSEHVSISCEKQVSLQQYVKFRCTVGSYRGER